MESYINSSDKTNNYDEINNINMFENNELCKKNVKCDTQFPNDEYSIKINEEKKFNDINKYEMNLTNEFSQNYNNNEIKMNNYVDEHYQLDEMNEGSNVIINSVNEVLNDDKSDSIYETQERSTERERHRRSKHRHISKDRKRDRSRHRSRNRSRQKSRHRSRDRSRHRRRYRSRDRSKDRSRHRSRDRRRDRKRERSRDKHRHRKRDRERSIDRHRYKHRDTSEDKYRKISRSIDRSNDRHKSRRKNSINRHKRISKNRNSISCSDYDKNDEKRKNNNTFCSNDEKSGLIRNVSDNSFDKEKSGNREYDDSKRTNKVNTKINETNDYFREQIDINNSEKYAHINDTNLRSNHINNNYNKNEQDLNSKEKNEMPYGGEDKNCGISSNEQEKEELSESEMIKKIIGISQFDTTENKCHSKTDLSGINRRTKRKYRQYMNRRGGFNRPLSPSF